MNKKTLSNTASAKRLFGYIWSEYRAQFLVVIGCILISAVTGVVGALFTKNLIDDYIAPLLLTQTPIFTELLYAIILMACVYFVGIVAAFVYNRMMVNISQGVLKKIRDEQFARMQKLPISYFDTHTHGDIMSRYTNDTDTLRQVLSQSIPQMFSGAITLVAVFISMLALSLPLTLIVVVFVPILLLTTQKIAGKSGSYFVEQQRSLGTINGYIEEMIAGQKIVKVFCHEKEAIEEFDARNDELFRSSDGANKYANILMPVLQNIGNLQYVVIAAVGGALALGGNATLTVGVIAAFLQLSKSFSQPISQMSQQLNSVVMALAGAGRIFTLMDETPEQDEGYVTLVNAKYEGDTLAETPEHTGLWAWKHPHEDGAVTYTKLTGDVRFFDVDFAYETGKPVLQNVTLYAQPGQKVAFVGATGAGKTTITNLINRFYDIADGKIRYDDININKIRKDDLRRSLGIVLQDTNLFTGTVAENIRYGKPDATQEQVRAAARIANADGFIERLPQGYDTQLHSAGANLSQGQRQLISIARAAIADPPVMILDEATSSIDTRTEAIVQRGMDGLMKGRTVFVIAHRLSTVQNSDVILVLDHGRVIERGSHEKLLEERGVYYRLSTGAFELE